jgi:putative SOS response-associated peptidase YedK
MCGRFAQQRPASELAEMFAAEPLVDDVEARYNLAPTDEALVVVERPDRRGLTAYRWGLVPHWDNKPGGGARRINARAETIATAPAFRDSFARKRCVVPADAFYEWKRSGGIRQPYAVRRSDRRPLALAGLWASWRASEDAEWLRTFTIVTTNANETIAPIHDRMPVILSAETWDRWLDPLLTDPAELLGLLVPADPGELDVYAVDRLVNSVRNDGPALLEPLPGSVPVSRSALD